MRRERFGDEELRNEAPSMTRHGLLPMLILITALCAAPGVARAVRPATDQEIAEFKAVTQEAERSGCIGEPCVPTRVGYEPIIAEARVSTINEDWATAHIAPLPHLYEEATVVFLRHWEPVVFEGVTVGARGIWSMVASGNDCGVGQNVHQGRARLMPDLEAAMGCVPVYPSRVRCLAKSSPLLFALEKPQNCGVAGPEDSPFPGWMNVRELKWHGWGTGSAWGLGVLRELPAGLLRRTSPTSSPAVASAVPLTPITVRLVASEMVSCVTAYYYSRLRVTSPFGHFELSLRTCPDEFYFRNSCLFSPSEFVDGALPQRPLQRKERV
jgi:hypothetical protein